MTVAELMVILEYYDPDTKVVFNQGSIEDSLNTPCRHVEVVAASSCERVLLDDGSEEYIPVVRLD